MRKSEEDSRINQFQSKTNFVINQSEELISKEQRLVDIFSTFYRTNLNSFKLLSKYSDRLASLTPHIHDQRAANAYVRTLRPNSSPNPAPFTPRPLDDSSYSDQ